MEKKQKKKYIQIIILSILMLIFAISIIFTSNISKGIKSLLYKADIKVSNDLIVHFINIGQGDAIALKFPNEEVMLIDAGPKNGQNYLVEYIKTKVLSSDNDLSVEYVLLTHPDIDHSGGLSAVFAEFDVNTFYRPNIASESENSTNFVDQSTLDEYEQVIQMAKKEKDLQINIINQKYEFHVGEVFVQIFAPLDDYSSTNSMSPIVKVSYLGKSFLFTGDIQYDSEYDMISTYGEALDADVLKVAHHGSYTSTSEAFVQVVTPSYAVICLGHNSYGHPHMEVVGLLEDYDAQVLTTKDSAVRFVCGQEMFGVLDENTTHSYEFVPWWVIALVIDIVLGIVLVKIVVKIIKTKKQEELSF